MSVHFNTALADFEAELEKMQAELATYAQRPEHSPRVLAFKRVRLQIMQNLVECFYDQVAEFSAQNQNLNQKLSEAETRIFKLEAICLLHGIGNSLFCYMAMPERTLGNLVKQCYGEQWRQTPLELMPDYPGPKSKGNAKTPLGLEQSKKIAHKAEQGLLSFIREKYRVSI